MTTIENINDLPEVKRVLADKYSIVITKTKKGRYHHPTGTDNTNQYALYDKSGLIGYFYKTDRQATLI